MAKRRFYLDTSVWCGLYESVFRLDTMMFFKMMSDERIVCLYSKVVRTELERVNLNAYRFLKFWYSDLKENVGITQTVKKLANLYISEGVVGETNLNDCKHIAAATVHKADMLVSWNFKHIVNDEKARGYNDINKSLGYQAIEIHSPKEVMCYGS